MKDIKKFIRLMMLLLLIYMIFIGYKDKNESEIHADFNHTENIEEIESSSIIPEGKESVKQEESVYIPKGDESEMQKRFEVSNSTNKIYREGLSAEGEKVLFGFQVADSNKIISICMADDESYIVYRFGTRDKIELEFPEDRGNSFSYFNYSYYLRGGGVENAGLDFNYFNFSNGDYQYQVYDEYEAETAIRAVGIRVIDEKTGKETDINGDSNSIIGSMTSFREMEKIIVYLE